MAESFLQTEDWRMFQESLGRKTWRFDSESIRANIILLDLILGRRYLYIPHGPEVALDTASSGLRDRGKQFIAYLRDLAHAEDAFFIKMEPFRDTVPEFLHIAGIALRKSKKEIQPHKTVIMDLDADDQILLGKMHHKTRYNINLADRKGLTLRESDDIDAFVSLLKKTSKRDAFHLHPDSYYNKLLSYFKESEHRQMSAKLFLVFHETTPIAGALILRYGDTAYYVHGASDHAYRSLMAPAWMHWGLMKRYRGWGCAHYDFWGIDARLWPGVTRFKLGFGGRVVEYPGSFDIPVSRFWYWTYRLSRALARR